MPKKLIKSPLSSPASSTFPAAPQAAPATLTDLQPLPRLIVFDLDYTLWPFWVDTHVAPPLKATGGHTSAVDKFGESFAFYADVPAILPALRAEGIRVGAASRTQTPDLARELLRLLYLPPPGEGMMSTGGSSSGGGKAKKAIESFDFLEIYPGSKVAHFEKIRKASGVDYRDMLFFDDEARNRNVETLGVTMWLVRDGVTRDEIDKGIQEWRKRRGVGGGHMRGKSNESGMEKGYESGRDV